MRRLIYQDEARLEYGRRFWRDPARKARLLAHWQDERHPYRERFMNRWFPWVDRVLSAPFGQDDELDAALQKEGQSLRAIVKEIPPLFGSFWKVSALTAVLTFGTIPPPEAMSLSVNDLVKEFPMKYSVELKRLIDLEMEGSIG